MKTCLFPGSFDPPTMGHIDLVKRALRLFDRVIVCVMANADKHAMFTPEQRAGFLEKSLAGLDGITVAVGSGLTLDMAKKYGADALLRGLRGEGDASLEAQLAAANRFVGGIETVALFTDPSLSFIRVLSLPSEKVPAPPSPNWTLEAVSKIPVSQNRATSSALFSTGRPLSIRSGGCPQSAR